MGGQNKNWRAIRERRPLNETRVAIYRRLMDAEARLEAVRRRRGVGETALAEALELSESGGPHERDEDVYLETLARYVAALGGHLEVQAVFPEETITVLREPAAE